MTYDKTQNYLPGLPPTESCECSRDGGRRGVQFVPDSAGVSVADVALSLPLSLGCIHFSQPLKRLVFRFLAWAPRQ